MDPITDYDVVVVGGGPGGLAAAIASARAGAKTVLLEREGCLGGGATTMMVNPFMPYQSSPGEPGGVRKVVNAGIFGEIRSRLIELRHAQDGICVGFDDEYLLSYADWKSCARFEDGVACCSYCIDVHQQEAGQTRIERLPPGGYYQIPYRCLTPKGLTNVLVAARSISADVEAHSSFRIMPTVMCIGQAAGTAAAMALPGGEVRAVDTEKLRSALRNAGAVVD